MAAALRELFMVAPVPVNRTMSIREWSMLIALSLVWGGSFFFNAIAVRQLPPFTIVTLRVGIAAVILNIVVRLTRLAAPRDRRAWAAFFGMGLLNGALPFSLIVWAQGHIASGLASILNATTPLFAVIVAHIFTSDEKMTSGRLAGVLIGLAGVAVMIGPQALGGMGEDTIADLACLAAALIYALAGVYGRRFKAMGLSPMVTASGQVTAATIILLPISLIVEQPWTLPMPSPSAWGAVLGIAVLSTAIAYVLYFRILAAAGATNLLLVTFLIPVSALLLGTMVLRETIVASQLAGMALIGAGLVAIDGRLARFSGARLRPPDQPTEPLDNADPPCSGGTPAGQAGGRNARGT
jgi:drug/metabolite transporter (DMT)-like permease